MSGSRLAAWLIAASFALVGLVNLVPIIGVLGAPALSALYGFESDDPVLLVLLRHRAVLLGVVGALMLVAAWQARWRGLAAALGLVSMASYVVLVWISPQVSAALQRIAWIDLLALPVLIAACWLHRKTVQPGIRARSSIRAEG